MADFNPQVQPTNDPNYFKYSEPIRGVEADKSAGLALSTAGKGIEDFASLAKQTAEDWIKKDVRTTVEKTRSDFTNDLTSVKDSLIPAPVSTASGVQANSPLNLMPGEGGTSTVPDDVKNAVDRTVTKLGSVKDSFLSGRGVNDTYYHMRLNTDVTALRARYPGFVDFIDEQVSKITGGIPANQVITDLMQDINHAASNKKSEYDKVVDLARTQGSKYAHGDDMYEALKNKGEAFVPTFMKWYSEENAKDTELDRKKSLLAYKTASGADVETDNKKAFSDWTATKISSDMNGILTLSGVDQPNTLMGFIKDATNNPEKYSGAQLEELAAKTQGHIAQLRGELLAQSNVEGWNKKIGVANRDLELDSQMKYYQGIYDGLKGGGPAGAGQAYWQMNQARGIADQTKYNFTKGSLFESATNFEMLSQKLGLGITATQLVPAFIREQKNLPDNLKTLFGEKVVEAHAQPGGENNPTTVTQHIAEVASEKRITQVEKGYLYKAFVNTVEEIKNPKLPDEDKAGVVRYLFDPSNNGVLQNWKMDYRTTSPDGRVQIVHPGKYAVWTDLTNNDVTKNIAKLDAKSQEYYKNWVDITGRELIGQDVKTLNHFTGHDNLYFHWKNEGGTPRLELKDREGALESPVGKDARTATRPPADSYIYQVKAVVDRINKALPNLENVYKTFGNGNTETMLLQTLQQYGLDFNGKVSGLPKAFGDAIAASRKAPEKKKDE